MIADLKSYLAYRDSGVPWLGEVPEHWEVRQLGRIGTFSKGNGGTKEDEVIEGVPCVRYGDLYTRHQFFIKKAKACVSIDRLADYTPIQYGDVLFAGSGETIEEIGKSAVNLLSEPACCGGDVIIFRPSIAVDAEFLGLATDCPQATYQKSSMGRGITIMHIYGDDLKYLSIALPPLPEQVAIGRFLDYIDRRTRRYIRAQRKLIALLEEQRQAIIQRAVTRGLDPNVRLKPSGVEWLGEVPGHWEILRNRWLFREVVDTGYPDAELLSIDRFRGVIRQSETGRKERAPKDRSAYKRVRPGEIAYNLMNAFMGSIGVSALDGSSVQLMQSLGLYA